MVIEFEIAVQNALKRFPPDHSRPLESSRLFAFSLAFPETDSEKEVLLRAVLRKDRIAVAQCMRSVPQDTLYPRINLMNQITIECMTATSGDADLYVGASPAEIAGAAFFQTKQQWPQEEQQMGCLLF